MKNSAKNKKKFNLFFLVSLLLLFGVVLIIVFTTDRTCNIEDYKGEQVKPMNIRIVALCTKNYLSVGEKGIEDLKDYCYKNDYEFKLFDKQLVEDLHINFTKMKIMQDELKKEDVDYTIISDVDIKILDDDIKMEKIIEKHMTGDKVVGMPQDRTQCLKMTNKTWLTKNSNSLFNAGLIIGKNGKEASDIMAEWINMARTKCNEEANTHPRNQNVFDKCVHPKYEKEIATLPYQLHGVSCSAGIRQKMGMSSLNPFKLHKDFRAKKAALKKGGHERQSANED